MLRSIVLFLLLTLSFSLYAEKYENLPVEKINIHIESNQPHPKELQAIKAQLQTKEKERFSHAEFDHDLKTLADQYDRVESSYEIINQKLHINLNVWLKPIIRSITIHNNKNISSKKLLKELDIELQTPFEREEFIKAFNKMKALYVKKGYFQAQLDYVLVPVENSTEVDIEITVNEGLSGKIKKIELRGVTKAEEKEILELLVTKKYNLVFSLLSNNGCYHPEMIEHDKMALTNFFQDRGFADATVNIAVEESTSANRINLVITVCKGACYAVGDIKVEGHCLFTDKEILDLLKFQTNWVYSPEQLRAGVKAITNLYGSRGYIDTTVDMAVTLRNESPVYDLTIHVTEGELYHVGLVKVFGNRFTHNRVILHEALLAPGELFDNRKLEATEIRLLNTGFFECVNVYAVQSQIQDEACCYRDIYIEVQECDTGNIGLFGGFSSIDRIFGGVEISESNFNLAGFTRLFEEGPRALRGGGEFALAKINIGDRQTAYTLQWSKPYFMDTPWIVSAELNRTNDRSLSKGYTLHTYGGNLHGLYIWNNFIKTDLHYRATHTRVKIIDTANEELIKLRHNSGLISAAGISLIYDSTDNPRRASCGLRSRLFYEVAGLGGNYQFMKFFYQNSYYYPVCRRGTFKFRGDVEFLHPWGRTTAENFPFTERLFKGGDMTVRGYRTQIIGPKFGNNEPAGGLSSYLLSEEYQHNILRNPCLDFFLFVDAGFVGSRQFRLGRHAASAGFGIRVEIMRNMPMTFGYGWPMHPKSVVNGKVVDNSQRFFFAMGGTF